MQGSNFEKIGSIFLQLSSFYLLSTYLLVFFPPYFMSQFYANMYNWQTTSRASETFQRLLEYFSCLVSYLLLLQERWEHIGVQAEARSLRSTWTSKHPDEHYGRPMWHNQRKEIRIWLVGHRSGSHQWSQSAFGNISQMAADRGAGTNTWLRLLLQSLLRGSRQCRRCLLWQIAWEEVCLNKDFCI